MNELYELREKLCKELKRYSKEDVTTNSLGVALQMQPTNNMRGHNNE